MDMSLQGSPPGKNPRIGLALGSGSSRGWAHIGVVQALLDMGMVPSVVCGTSIGALVGGAYACGNLSALEEWALSLRPLHTLGYMSLDLTLSGMVNTEKVLQFLNRRVCTPDVLIEDLPCRFAAIATDLLTGRETRLESGPLQSAIRSSMAYPGLFPAVLRDGTWLVDGGLVNPVPVSVCRALGAEVVIAVNLNDSLVGRHFPKSKGIKSGDFPLAGLLPKSKDPGPTMFDTMAGSLNIMQDWITRTRMVLEPPDLVISPRLSHFGLLEIHRAREAMEEGRRSVEAQASALEELLEFPGNS